MLVLITYDVQTTTPHGRKRLRLVAKQCLNYGQRVQNSVFECVCDTSQLVKLKGILSDLIDHETDSLRFYHLGKNWQNRIDHIGAKQTYDPESTLII